MYVEDFAFITDDSGIEFVTYEENPTKTRQVGHRKKRRCRSTQDDGYRWTEMPCNIVQNIFGTKTRRNAKQWSILSCRE